MSSKYAQRPSQQQRPANSDSGYGGSVEDGDHELSVSVLPGPSADPERKQWASHVHQLYYNQNRVALGRWISRTVETLKSFQNANRKWPAHYSAAQRPEIVATDLETSEQPRLVTPQIAQEFNVLKLDPKLVHTLEKSPIASLLDGKIGESVKHLMLLRDRIEDTSSKVLVTGDLNAGKSTFCNALLRKKILPEDEQPCTNIFCEVLDARENSSIEEIHAIPLNGALYSRNDSSTYDIYPLDKLEEIVVENDKYCQVKIYVEDVRAIDESLLRNGVVDIAIIDAPGLNSDSIKTTAVFARQEEIDVVVFVVNAEYHFTLSAKDFIQAAANEKAYIFIVVNRFDNIRNKDRCQRLILEQVAQLSPRTHQDAKELVHFVSSNAVIEGSDGDKLKDFDNLEQSLRRFVLEKRARSKLAPAKHYLLNILGDLETLAEVNKNAISAELEKVQDELSTIAPEFQKSVQARTEVSENVEATIDDTCGNVYKFSRKNIANTIAHIDDKASAEYDGILSAYAYAEKTKEAMLQRIQNSVTICEEYARNQTVGGICSIKALGIMHLRGEYTEKAFRKELMFSRKRHQLSKTIDIEINLFDFFDFDKQEKVAGMSMGLTVATMAGGQLFGVSSWIDGLWKATSMLGPRTTRKLIIPALLVAGAAGAWFLIADIPNAVPRKLAKKIRKELEAMDYVHNNSERITKECRKVLGLPAEELRESFRRSIEKQGRTMEEKRKIEKDSGVAFKYFGGLLREAREHKGAVMKLDLEGPPSGITA